MNSQKKISLPFLSGTDSRPAQLSGRAGLPGKECTWNWEMLKDEVLREKTMVGMVQRNWKVHKMPARFMVDPAVLFSLTAIS